MPALGGGREIPAPDPIARDYLLLALRLDQRIAGLVDGYFGPADLKAQVDMEPLPSPGRLRRDARDLRAQVAVEVADRDPDRANWLTAQLVALETHAADLDGEHLRYVEHVERCFDWRPTHWPEAPFERAAAELDDLVPGPGPLVDRLADFEDRLTVPPDRLADALGWLVSIARARAEADFGLPGGEDLRVSLVRDRPWSGYNWYDGGRRSRVEINIDLPTRAPDLLGIVAHETYPGHHLEHAWKEAELVETRGRVEASAMLINAPECLLSEGLADLGRRFAFPSDTHEDLLVELFDRAGLAIAADPEAARDAARRSIAILAARQALAPVRGNAALLRHADGRGHDEVRDYLIRYGLMTERRAEKRLEFIEHPLWRSYVVVYAEGEALLGRWLDQVPREDQPARFARLLHEQLTPSAISAEIATGQGAGLSARSTTPRASR